MILPQFALLISTIILKNSSLVYSCCFRFYLFLKSVYPFSPQKQIQENAGTDAPGQRIGPVDVAYLPEEPHHQRDVAHAQYAPDGEHYEHRHEGLARAAADRRDRVRKRQQAVEQRDGVGLPHAERDDVGLAAESTDEPRRRSVDGGADDLGHEHRAQTPELHALLHAVRPARADVLADERRQRHGKAGHGQEGKALYLAVRAAPGHGLCTERVDVGLHNDVGNRDDRVLDAGRQALHDDSL